MGEGNQTARMGVGKKVTTNRGENTGYFLVKLCNFEDKEITI